MTLLIGTAPNQVPTNADLGSMSTQNSDSVNITGGFVEATLLNADDISDAVPAINIDFTAGIWDSRLVFYRWSSAYYYDGKSTVVAEMNSFINSELSVAGQNSATPFHGWDWNGLTGYSHTTDTTAPDGTYTAVKLLETSATTNHSIWQSLEEDYSNTGRPWCISFYFKSVNTGITRYVKISAGPGSTDFGFITANLANGSISTQPGNNAYVGTTGGPGVTSGVSYNGAEFQPITGTTTSVGNGWYRMNLILASYVNTIFFSLNDATTNRADNWGRLDYAGNTGMGMYVWGFQAEARDYLTGYYPTRFGKIANPLPLLVRAQFHEPRFGADPVTGQSWGVLVEHGITNYVYNSGDLTAAQWTRNNVTAQGGEYRQVAPDGTFSAVRMIETSGSSQRSWYNSNLNGRTDDWDLIMSCWVKEYRGGSPLYGGEGAKRYLWMGMYYNTGGQYGYYVFDIDTMDMVYVRGTYNASNQGPYQFDYNTDPEATHQPYWHSQDCGNGWRRLSIWVQPRSFSNALGTWTLYWGMTANRNPETWSDLSYTGDGNSGFWFWGPQVEYQQRGGFGLPTSYVPTLSDRTTYRSEDTIWMWRDNIRNTQVPGYPPLGSNQATRQIFATSYGTNPQHSYFPGPRDFSIYVEYMDWNKDGYPVGWTGAKAAGQVYSDYWRDGGPSVGRDGYSGDQIYYSEIGWLRRRFHGWKASNWHYVRKLAIGIRDGDSAYVLNTNHIPTTLTKFRQRISSNFFDRLFIGNWAEGSHMTGGIRKLQVYWCRLPDKELADKVN